MAFTTFAVKARRPGADLPKRLLRWHRRIYPCARDRADRDRRISDARNPPADTGSIARDRARFAISPRPWREGLAETLHQLLPASQMT